MEFDLQMTDALLATTRAVRKRLDLQRPVARETILECLELAVQAPTGGNGQGWRWLVVEEEPMRTAIAEIYRDAARGYLDKAHEKARDAGNAQTTRVYESALYLAEVLHRVPVHVIPCIRTRRLQDLPLAQQAGLFGSIFPAIWSFQLALRARGLGSVCLQFLESFHQED